MATLTINDKQYDIDKLAPEAKAKLDSARFCEQKIEQLEAELAVVRTAKTVYLQALPALLSDEALVANSVGVDAGAEKQSANADSLNAGTTTKH